LRKEHEVIDSSAFKNYSFFGGLLPDEIEAIRPLMGGAVYEAGADILREGEPNDCVHFILEGSVEVLKEGVRLATLAEGDTFGEMEFLDVMPAVATVRALTPSTVATISNHALHELSKASMRAFAMVVMNLARDLSRRLRRMDDIVAKLDKAPVHPRG
jgi:CRP/FNR family transcriptional regulator, cyclic AMP receptor protein